MKKIYGYYHILMINHYEEIVREQIDCMVNSGLYDACEKIYIGALGGNEELKTVIDIIKDYPKISIEQYSKNVSSYEFFTLDILKRHADSAIDDYNLFYIHGKGVSYPKPSEENKNKRTPSKITYEQAYTGGTIWRKHMNRYTLEKWEENVEALKKYQVYGAQLRPKSEFPQHYSGNSWWTTSDYVKMLKPIAKLNNSDRFEAEMWICSANPIAGTISQEFVDYNSTIKVGEIKTSPQIIKPYTEKSNKERSHKIVCHTLAFNLTSQVERATKSLYELNTDCEFEHYIIDLEFPLLVGDEIPSDIDKAIETNTTELKRIAKQYGSKYLKLENIGVSQNWTQVYKALDIKEYDVLIGVCPDEVCVTKGWVKAMADALNGWLPLALVSLTMKEQLPQINKSNSRRGNVGDINLDIMNGAMMWAQIGVSARFLNMCDGMPIPKDYGVYGYLESACYEAFLKHGFNYAMLPDYLVEHPDNTSKVYRAYKDDLIFGDYKGKNQIKFIDWLKAKA